MLSRWRLFIVACLLFSMTGAPAGIATEPGEHDSLGTVPVLVHNYMRKVSCAPIRDFYSGAVDTPPFVQLGQFYFAFVCERRYGAADVKYDLVVDTRDNKRWHPFATCPQIINLAAKPGGLRLGWRNITRQEWGSFFSIGDASVTLESSGRGGCLQGELLILTLDAKDGFTEYACINDEWYFSPADNDE